MFFRKSRRESKAILEHKLYLVRNVDSSVVSKVKFIFQAKETPEPIFDLSECDIKEVPQGIYSLCRVFLKERLLLQSNNLSSLSGGGNLTDLKFLKVLNISYNSFINLPESIGCITSLKVSYRKFINIQEVFSHNYDGNFQLGFCRLK